MNIYSKPYIDTRVEDAMTILTTVRNLAEHLCSINDVIRVVVDELTHGYYPKPDTRAFRIEHRTVTYIEAYILYPTIDITATRLIPYLRSYFILKYRMAPTK